ncbi:hypothetical protein [Treponema sp.]|uniref:hypothetical protein n=1 Tax=Treponema sp. TaxID=166 RepID=UPI00298EAF68|nr:hypothetical protein [Treponema sp.]MCR5613107.1 hypothetical protein [Treponema sp.]
MKHSDECSKIMDTYLELDKGERIPWKVTLHLLTCSKCRKQVKMLKAAEKIARSPIEIPVPIDDSSILAVMSKINPDYQNYKNPISIAKWIIAGVVMILFMLTFGLSSYQKADKAIMISFYILFACVVTAYCAMFVGTNIDYFVKLINAKKIKLD